MSPSFFFFFFFNDTATTEIYTLSLHDALPISSAVPASRDAVPRSPDDPSASACAASSGSDSSYPNDNRIQDRKSTRLNSSHLVISYAVFCLKKKKKKKTESNEQKNTIHKITNT